MTYTIELTPEECAELPEVARLRLLSHALPEAQKPEIEAGEPASGEELEAMFLQWRADAPEPTPEEDAAYEAMLRRATRERPFFLYLPHTAVHVPLHPGEKFRGRSANGTY